MGKVVGEVGEVGKVGEVEDLVDKYSILVNYTVL